MNDFEQINIFWTSHFIANIFKGLIIEITTFFIVKYEYEMLILSSPQPQRYHQNVYVIEYTHLKSE